MKLVCLTVFEMICRLYAVDMLDSGIRHVYSHSRLLKVSYVDDESATKVLHNGMDKKPWYSRVPLCKK